MVISVLLIVSSFYKMYGKIPALLSFTLFQRSKNQIVWWCWCRVGNEEGWVVLEDVFVIKPSKLHDEDEWRHGTLDIDTGSSDTVNNTMKRRNKGEN